MYLRKKKKTMLLITFKRHTYHCNDVNTAADIILGETGDERDYERIKYIIGNMKFAELFYGKNFIVQCYKEDSNND